jgi:MFS family permease
MPEPGNAAGRGLGAGDVGGQPGPDGPTGLRARLGPLSARNFRTFYIGYATSLLGSAMSAIALTFAVLESGGTPADLGYVFAARVVPQVLVMLGGGVLADRMGRRPVMLITDSARLAVQGTLAGLLFAGRPSMWAFLVLSALLAAGEGFFNPALGGLRAEIAPRATMPDASALLAVAQSAAMIIGPALAGGLIALTSPAVVTACDAASYGVSVLCLARLTVPAARLAHQSAWRDLAEGWREFTVHAWLWQTTLQYTLFNLLTWAPYLLLGPILARQYLGGAGAWGIILAAYACGSVAMGLALVGRRPRRLLVISTAGTFGFALPPLMLALHAPLWAVAAGAVVAGAGASTSYTYSSTAIQQQVPPHMLSRVNGIELTAAYALGSVGYAVIGPLATLIGPGRILGFAAAYALASSALVLASPAVRSVRWHDDPPGGQCP